MMNLRGLLSMLALLSALAAGQERGVPRVFESLDRDGDRRLSAIEYAGSRVAARLGPFAEVDADHDGFIDSGEALDAWRRRREQAEAESGPEEMVVHRDLRYRTLPEVEARHHSLDIFTRPGVERLPVLVMIHGGGWRRGDKAGRGVIHAKSGWFVSQGYVFVSINYRLSPAVRHPAHVDDVAAALVWVRDHASQYGGDPERIFLMGHSSGAHLAALVATDHRRLAAHGAELSLLSGVICLDTAAYDVPRYVNELGAGPRVRAMYEIAFGKTEEAWRDASPRHHVTSGKGIPPTLLFHTGARLAGETLSQELVVALRAAGTPARSVHARDRDHAGINRCIGKPDDPYTKIVMEFLAGSREGAKPSPAKLVLPGSSGASPEHPPGR